MKKVFVCFLAFCCIFNVFLMCGCGHNENSKKHTYVMTVIEEPTCVEKGLAQYVCSKCNLSYFGELDYIDHVYKREIVEANCVHGGYTELTCEVCGDSFITNQTPPNNNHHYHVTGSRDSNCSLEGYIEYTCEDCGNSYRESLPLTCHVYETKVINGVTVIRCKYCGILA